MKVKFKKLHEAAVLPSYSKEGDAGMDLHAISRFVSTKKENEADYIEYGTGLSVEIPKGYVGLLFPRSSISKKDMILANSVGVIDSGYRGEITFRFKIAATYDVIETVYADFVILKDIDENGEILNLFSQCIYDIEDRVGQLIIIPYPEIETEWADELSQTQRGEGGYGSTGA